ncbi:MAG: ATP-binding protein [Myxococcota bacterium]
METRPVDLVAWRRLILDRVLGVSAVVSLAACVAGVWLALEGGVPSLAAVDVACWLGIAAAAAARGAPYTARALVLLGALGTVGVAVLALTGPYGTGLVWLAALPGLAGVLFGPRGLWGTELAVTAALCAVYGLASGPVWTALAPMWWPLAWTSVLCASLLMGVPATSMMRGLERSLVAVEAERRALAEEIERRQRAEAERAALEKQLAVARKMEAVGQMAGGFVHDLNNVLTVIRIEAELLEPEVPDHARGSVDDLLRAAASATALCERLLTFARQPSAERATLELDAQLRGLEPMLARLAGDNVQVTLALGGAGAAVRAGGVEIEQLLTNLLANARDASPDGGEVVISTAVVPHERGSRLRLVVTDTGCGMTPSTLDRVFEPFFTTKPRGTGLGLATVFKIVSGLGGTVAVNSSPGRGTTFEIELPTPGPDRSPPLDAHTTAP